MAKGQNIAGIDIGTDKICTIIAALSPQSDRVNVVGVASVESKGIRKSQIVDIEDAIESITESVEAAERMAGYSVQNAFVTIGGNHIGSQNSKGVVAVAEPEGEIIQEDITRVIEAARAISLPASREVLHVIPRDFVVDGQEGIKDPTGMTGVRLEAEAHIVTAASTSTKNLQKCVAEVGININELVFSGLAAASSTVSETERELGVVLIDIGAGTTSICVFADGSLAHSAVLPVGARNITNDLAIGMRVSLGSAEIIKKYLSKSSPNLVRPKEMESSKDRIERRKKEDVIDLSKLHLKEDIKNVSRKTLTEGIIRPRLNEIFQMIGKELKNSGFAASTPAGAVLTGGGAKTVGITDSCKRTLSMPTRVGVPKGLSGLVEEIQNPAFAASMGLITYALTSSSAPHPKQSMPGFGGVIGKFPGKAAVNKLTDLAKMFLP